ncbi:MAG: hypothetical protein AAF674_13855 [Pseudomonadota bacterium]
MLGLFGIFGRSDQLKALDQSLREYDVHPRLVPDAVKLAVVRLLRNASDPGYIPKDADYQKAAELLCYAILGPDQFVASNSLAAAESAGKRLENAIDAGDSLDAGLILLAANAGIIHPNIANQFEIDSD